MRNGTPLEVKLDVGDVVASVDGLCNDVPLQQLTTVDVPAVCVSDHHPNSEDILHYEPATKKVPVTVGS